MKLKFTKMHGAGNDFIVIDAIHQHIDFTTEQWQRLADRRFGVGADQILVVQKSDTAGCHFRYRIYNADGGEVEQCGNGARAFARFVAEKGLSDQRTIRVETMSGIIAPTLEANGAITVDMGAPVFGPAEVPFDCGALQGLVQGRDTLWPLSLDHHGIALELWVSVLSMGNPHAVQLVADVDSAPVASSGPLIEHHPRFPNRVNAGYMQVLGRQQIKLRVHERGAGETLACGTGACAAVVAGIRRGLLDSPVKVSARGGHLSIAWGGEGSSVFLTGPAETVFEGEIEI